MKWSWCAPVEAPVAQGMVAAGAAARVLLQAITGAESGTFRVAAHAELLVVLGAFDRLPWVADATYIAPAGDAAGLWLPTNVWPDVAVDLVQAALVRRHGPLPLLLLPSPAQLVSLARVVPLDGGWVARLQARWAGA